ncbi:DDB1- and CUL4-associated factor 8 [Epargyreus clarus]|uniref:DDB1- and CUL4-associated factor 8 n=1 Tax=Epargyreus clarus TaxID=520877 RepID=UPI003C2FF20C
MEDNSLSDDEIKDSPVSPKMGVKKLKLNDGSSQDSFKETASASKEKEKEDNVDSGLSADKSESTSSEDRGAGPSEAVASEIVHVAPSSSNVRAILLNIRRPRRLRNYRKRKTPDGGDSDSNDSSRDSDDLSPDEGNMSRQADNTSDAETATFSDSSASVSSKSSSGNNFESSSNDLVGIPSEDIDSEDDVWSIDNEDTEENKGTPPTVLTKTRPKHNYLLLREIINREMGLTFPCGKAAKNDVIFEQKFYGSLHAVYRLKKLHHLMKHRGCVNSINFHPEGHLLASGSDDTNVVVWDWAKKKALQTIKTGHKSNVFQSKFLHLNARSQLNIVTCARDGQVRLLQCPPSGGAAVSRRRLAAHYRAAHKLHVCAEMPHQVISAGEDGVVMRCDLRSDQSSKLFQVLEHGMYVPLYSVAGHPLNSCELLVAGRNKFVRVYDSRKPSEPVALYCPGHFHDKTTKSEVRKMRSQIHLTCAVYNHDGSEILGSYNDEDIYLFNARTDAYNKDSSDTSDGYTHRYSGHRNSATFKGVSFFGPRSQYVVSGSDCSHVFVWERSSEAIVQWLQADVQGVVNCIEAHPRCPVLATSGLDKDIKIWIPRSEHDPTFDGMEKVIRENGATARPPLFRDFLPTLYSAWRDDTRALHDDDTPPFGGNIEFDGNVCTTF